MPSWGSVLSRDLKAFWLKKSFPPTPESMGEEDKSISFFPQLRMVEKGGEKVQQRGSGVQRPTVVPPGKLKVEESHRLW